MTNQGEIWQVEVNNQIYETNVEELRQWIAEGALLPADKVRRGNLRWLEANKIPLLYQFFNAKDQNLPFPVLQSVTDASPTSDNSPTKTENIAISPAVSRSEFKSSPSINRAEISTSIIPPTKTQSPDVCVLHAGEEPKYVCENCANLFCKNCPKSYGASVKICPMCGAMCQPIADAQAKNRRDSQYRRAVSTNFGFADFGNALAYPFKFKISLIFGAIMFVFFTLGQSAAAMGGTVLFASGIISAALANTLTFGCLANTLENFAGGNTEANFMPTFDEFELWDDVIHPFFLSLGTYLVSFGLLAALLAGAFYYAMKSFDRIETEKQKIVSTVLPDARNDLNSAKEIPQINQIQKQLNEQSKWKNGEMPDEKAIANSQQNTANEEAEFKKLQAMIDQSRQSQLESAFGKSPESEREKFNRIAESLLRLSLFFTIPIFLAFLWGVFYFPAACAVAGYTRSFTAVLNPIIGLDTIKRLGFGYAKILAMFLLLGFFSLAVSYILGIVFSPFNLPQMGNLPAKAVGSFITFYFSIVFSVTLGYALYKNSERLNLSRG